MAVFLLEPHAMAISRTPDRLKNGHDNSNDDDYIDYRKLPRSSGDGMEHAGNHAEPSPHSPNSTPSHQANKTPNVHTSEIKYNVMKPHGNNHVKHQYTAQNGAVKDVAGVHGIQRSDIRNDSSIAEIQNDLKGFEYRGQDSSSITRTDTLKLQEDLLPSLIDRGVESVVHNYSPTSMYHGHNYLKEELLNYKAASLDEDENKANDSERTIPYEEFSKMQNIIKDLEDRNTKLVEDKTKLCVQLGLQTQVNSDLKKLVVAAVGEDLENSLEALLMKNAQSAVEIKHWKMLSEEYAEESDKFAIECDVWRTKFMASRMMSDELCSWKTTLYTKFKQTQSALQRILNEREELKKYLLKTKRLLHVLGDSMQHGGGFYKHGSEASNEGHCVGQQSVLELASVVSCLMQDLTTDMLEDVQGVSVPAKALALTEEAEKQTVEPTPGEKLAIQVLISDVDVELHTAEQPADSTVMTRLGKQYIGNSYHSRLLTNSFRVTYDCCDRCKGPVQVV